MATRHSARGGERVVYLDHAATTPCDPRVAGAMAEVYGEPLGNPHALHHLPGRRAAAMVAEARERIARAAGAEPDDVVITSGATESNNLAIRGVALGATTRAAITCRTEHASVLRPCEQLAAEGWRVDHVATDRWGRIDPADVGAALRHDTCLVSLMWINNELGTIHDVAAIGARVRAHGALFHVDATQALGRVPIDVRAAAIDLLTLSGHKVYGPHGVGALIAGPRARARGLAPLAVGGGQQAGIRPGTVNVAGAVGLGVACELAGLELPAATAAAAALSARIRTWLAALPGAHCLSPPDAAPGLIGVGFEGIDATDLLACLERVAISAHAACHDELTRTSHVLAAVGVPAELAAGAVRISVGRTTTPGELERGLAELTEKLTFLRALRMVPHAPPAQTSDAKGDDHG